MRQSPNQLRRSPRGWISTLAHRFAEGAEYSSTCVAPLVNLLPGHWNRIAKPSSISSMNVARPTAEQIQNRTLLRHLVNATVPDGSARRLMKNLQSEHGLHALAAPYKVDKPAIASLLIGHVAPCKVNQFLKTLKAILEAQYGRGPL